MLSRTFHRSFKSYSVLRPYIDVGTRLSNVEGVKANIRRRKLEVSVDEISAFHENLKGLEKVRDELEESREIVRRQLSASEKDENEERKLKMTAKILREDHKQIKSAILDLEQNLAALVMRVPNELDPRTPDEDEIFHEKVVPQSAQGCHVDIGKALDIIEMKSPTGIFLKDEAAYLELDVVGELNARLSKMGFVGFSNPDFVREIVSYGCTGTYGSSVTLTPFEENDDATYLTGGAALEPFFAFFAKTSLKELPVRCYSSGRRYCSGSRDFGLFQPWQTNAVQLFVVTCPSSVNEQIEEIISTLINFYEELDVSFRVVIKSSSRLSLAESLRYSFEAFSPHFDRYFEIGHVSLYGDLLSKNMNLHVSSDGENEFAHTISGTALSIAPLLASILETKGNLNLNLRTL